MVGGSTGWCTVQLMKICPRCLGEGELRIPPYGYMKENKWYLEPWWDEYIEGGSEYKVVSDCKPCGSTGYLKTR